MHLQDRANDLQIVLHTVMNLPKKELFLTHRFSQRRFDAFPAVVTENQEQQRTALSNDHDYGCGDDSRVVSEDVRLGVEDLRLRREVVPPYPKSPEGAVVEHDTRLAHPFGRNL